MGSVARQLHASLPSCTGQLPVQNADAGCQGHAPPPHLPRPPNHSPIILFIDFPRPFSPLQSRTARALGRGWLFDGSEEEDDDDAAADAGQALDTNGPIDRVFDFGCCKISTAWLQSIPSRAPPPRRRTPRPGHTMLYTQPPTTHPHISLSHVIKRNRY